MRTGYTDRITDTMSLREFALICARAFGAAVEMREEPLDKPIPGEFKPSQWHVKELEKARSRLAELRAMTSDDIAKGWRADFDATIQANAEAERKSRELEAKYRRMLAMVEAWTPPTQEHAGLKKFMVEQITESIRFDCVTFTGASTLSPAVWYEAELARAEKDIAYHIHGQAEEERRTASRNEWIRVLRESLPKDGAT